MCGIVGYIGTQQAPPILLKGLHALEYRGYDSAGMAVHGNDRMHLIKSTGNVDQLEDLSQHNAHIQGTLGIAHTRWATHGAPTEPNAHPHTDCTGKIFLVHNGIVENYRELRAYLEEKGHTFISETDTEVIAHLIEEFHTEKKEFKEALWDALHMIRGAYALALMEKEHPDVIYAARYSSPLIIGVGEGEHFLASDPSALVGNTTDAVYMKDGEIAEITRDTISLSNVDHRSVPIEITKLEWTLEQAQKGSYDHFMLKEIFEGPDVVRSAFRGRININDGSVKLGGLDLVQEQLSHIKRMLVLGCGTSYYAGLIGEYFFEEIAHIPTEVHVGSEFRYRTEPFEQGTVALAISQSGETADTLAALRKTKEKGLLTLGLVNVVGSTIARETDAGVYNHAGPEIGVASTKAFLSQLTTLLLIALSLTTDREEKKKVLHELELIPEKMEDILSRSDEIRALAEKYAHYLNFLFLGRRYSYPTAMEGALKLKEISYLHAEGYGAGEMKHGPLALIDEKFPTIAIMPNNSVSEKMHSNLEEIKARGGKIIAIATQNDTTVSRLADDVFSIPKTIEALEPLLAVVPLQLFAYYMGVNLGYDVDKPRNLAKSVTVE